MAQETPIGNLGNMNQEDSQLVDSILNDLNSGQKQQHQQHQQQQQQPQYSPEQQQAMLAERQRELEMQQEQQMQEQMYHQQMMEQQANMVSNTPNDIMEKIKDDGKYVVVVVILCIIVNMGFVDELFKMNEMTIFLTEAGTLNTQAIVIKAVAVGLVFFVIKYFMPE